MGGFMGSITDTTKLMALAIRETLMEYYKGTCIQRLTSTSSVDLVPMEQASSGDHYYLRREATLRSKKLLFYDGIPIATLCKNPMTIKFESTAIATNELAEVKELLIEFLRTYLTGVKEL
jgi:hypothetical protein